MPSPTEIREEMDELKMLIRGHRNLITKVTTTMTNDQFYNRAISTRQATIDRLQSQINELNHERHHGDEMIKDSATAIESLVKRVQLLKHSHTIAKMIKLNRKIAAAMENTT